jgi:SAM-dependent methyltransferase
VKTYDIDEVRRCYDLAARAYSDKFLGELESKPLDRWLLERFAASLRSGTVVYDFGCGSGQTTRFLRSLGLRSILGLDISPATIALARERNPDLCFEVDDMLRSRHPDASAEGIVAFYAIVHFGYHEFGVALSEWHRLLKPGGRLLFSFHAGRGSLRSRDFLEVKGAVATWRFLDPGKVLGLVRAAGFAIEEALVREPYGGAEHPSKRCYVLAAKGRIDP